LEYLAEKASGCCSHTEHYEILTADTEEDQKVIFHGISIGHEFCLAAGIPSIVLTEEFVGTKNKEKRLLKLQFETSFSCCATLPKVRDDKTFPAYYLPSGRNRHQDL
jgi:hypothetical protein